MAVGHRPLSDIERLGYFHAQINMGQAMNIQELNHDWDEMRAWFDGLSRAVRRVHAAEAAHVERRSRTISIATPRSPTVVGRFRRTLEKIGDGRLLPIGARFHRSDRCREGARQQGGRLVQEVCAAACRAANRTSRACRTSSPTQRRQRREGRRKEAITAHARRVPVLGPDRSRSGTSSRSRRRCCTPATRRTSS